MEYNLNNSLIKFNNIDEYVKFIKDKKPNTLKKNKIYYINEPVSFDIETTSIGGKANNICENKYAFMYIWAFSFCGYIYYARTWNEFFQLIGLLKFYLGINLENRLVIYVHNLAYEFQFIRKLFEWESVFSLSERKPIKAVSKDGIEFRCSYHLSGYSLALLGRGLNKYKVEKMVGDLDYSLIRTKLTPLSDTELKYVINDVLVVTSYIQEKIELDGGITKIPLTKTGYVRNYCRERCLYVSRNHHQGGKKFVKYRRLMKELVLTPELYAMLKQAFMGGFTHANPLNSNQTHQNVYSFDFTSSYPYVMVSEKFPMSKPYKFKIKNEEDLSNKLDKYCCVFYVEFTKIESTIDFENYIPKSHCLEYKNISENNGRIITADFISMVLTEQDYMIIKKTYKKNGYSICSDEFFNIVIAVSMDDVNSWKR